MDFAQKEDGTVKNDEKEVFMFYGHCNAYYHHPNADEWNTAAKCP